MKNNAAMEDHWSNNPRFKEALAEQPAQGCEFCSHPLYAGTKCKNCGREQSAQQEPKIGCVNHDCDKCKAQQQQEPVAYRCWNNPKNADGTFDSLRIWVSLKPEGYGNEPLYTSPQPAQQEPLTDEQIWKNDQIMSLNADLGWHMDTILMFVRVIEAAHQIGVKK